MPIESAQYVDTLQSDWPLGTDPESAGDDHIRMIKQVLQNTFPNMNASFGMSPTQGNALQNGFVYQAAASPQIELWKARSHAKDDGSLMGIMALTATAQNFKDNPNLLVTYQALLNVMMPVGTVYENYSNATNPATLLGFGTWTALVGYSVGVGVCTDGAGLAVTFSGGHNGGVGNWRVQNGHIVAATLNLTMDAVADHSHTTDFTGHISNSDDGSGKFAVGSAAAEGTPPVMGTSSAGGHTPAGKVTIGSGTTTSGTNFVPPYHTTYRWVRTA